MIYIFPPYAVWLSITIKANAPQIFIYEWVSLQYQILNLTWLNL